MRVSGSVGHLALDKYCELISRGMECLLKVDFIRSYLRCVSTFLYNFCTNDGSGSVNAAESFYLASIKYSRRFAGYRLAEGVLVFR